MSSVVERLGDILASVQGQTLLGKTFLEENAACRRNFCGSQVVWSR